MNWYKVALQTPSPELGQTPEQPPQIVVQENPQTPQTQNTQSQWVAAVIVYAEQKVLILKRGMTAPWMPGYWNLPGGITDDDESPQQTATRECEEEAGITPNNLQHISSENQEGGVVHFFCSIMPPTKVKICWESSDHQWITLQEINSYQFVPGVKEAIMATFQKLSQPNL